MTTVILRPDATIAAGTVTGAASTHAATNDNDDASYVVTSSQFAVHLGTSTLPAGSVTKQWRARIRHLDAGGPKDVYLYMAGSFNPGDAGYVTPGYGSFSAGASPQDDSAAWSPTTLTQAQVDNMAIAVFATSTGRTHELYADLMYVAIPVVAVDTVTDPTTATNLIPLSWVNTLDADGGAQTHRQIRVFDETTYPSFTGLDPDDDVPYWDSGIVLTGSAMATTIALPNDTHRAYVRVAQTVNGSLHWSDWDFDEFTVAVDTSDVATVDVAAVDATGAIEVTVGRDGASEAWSFVTVERSIDAGATWQPVRGATYVDSTGDADEFVILDYEAPNGTSTKYRARATRIFSSLPITGDWVESDPEQWTSTAMFLKVPGDAELNVSTVCLASRTPYRRTRRTGVFPVLGARLPVVVSDVRSARSGVIEWETLTSAEATAIDTLLERGSVVLVQFPPSMDIADMYAAFTDDEEVFQSIVSDVVWRTWSVNYIEVAQPPDPYAGA